MRCVDKSGELRGIIKELRHKDVKGGNEAPQLLHISPLVPTGGLYVRRVNENVGENVLKIQAHGLGSKNSNTGGQDSRTAHDALAPTKFLVNVSL